MSFVKITDLPAITSGSTEFNADVLPIVDITADVTNKITLNDLKGSLGLNLIERSGNNTVLSSSLLTSGSIVPNVEAGSTISSFELGSSIAAWKDVWVSSGSINFINNSGTIQSSLSAYNGGVNVSGSLTTNVPGNVSYTFPSKAYKLGFNNISDYVVTGGSGTQNLGAGTVGMSLIQDISSLLYTKNGSNYVIKCRVLTAEQYGGVTNTLGLRVAYSSANGATFFDSTATATRIAEFGSNYALQFVNLTFNIPDTISGAATSFVKFEVIMSRSSGGNTSVYSSELIFSI
jgi:hypothetical protein